jgi:hypothetical protein
MKTPLDRCQLRRQSGAKGRETHRQERGFPVLGSAGYRAVGVGDQIGAGLRAEPKRA